MSSNEEAVRQMSATSVGEIGLDLVVNQNKFNKQMSGIQSLAKKAGGALAAAFAVKKLVAFGDECLELGSDLQEVQNVVDVTFPNMSKKVNTFSKDAAASFGLSETMAKKFTGTFGTMAKAFGFSEQQAYEMGTALTGLAGDVASFYNITQDEAYTKLKSVFSGETESLKDLGVVMTQTALDSYALANGYGKTTKAMSEAEKVALRYAFVQDKLSAATGDFIRTSDGWANQVRVLKLQFDSLKATIGQGLINLFTPVIKLINTIIAKISILAEKFKQFTEFLTGKKSSGGSSGLVQDADLLAESVSGIGEAAKKSSKQLKQLAGFDELNNLSSSSSSDDLGGGIDSSSLLNDMANIEQTTEKAEESADRIKKLLNNLGLDKFLDDYLKTNKEKIQKWTQDIKEISIDTARNFVKGSENIFDSLQQSIQKNKEYIRQSLLKISTDITDILINKSIVDAEVWQVMSQSFSEFTKTYEKEIEDFFSGISISVFDFTSMFTGCISDSFSTIRNWWEKEGKPVWQEVTGTIGAIAGRVLAIWNTIIQPVIDDMTMKLQNFWQEHLRPLLVSVLGHFSSIGNSFSKVWKQIEPAVDFIIKYVGPIISIMLKDIGDKVFSLLGIIADTTTGITTYLSGFIDYITGVFTLDLEKTFGAIVKMNQGTLEMIRGAVEGTIETLIGKEKWDKVKKCFSEVAVNVKNAWSDESQWFGENVIQPIVDIFEGCSERVSQIVEGMRIIVQAIWITVSDWFDKHVVQPIVTAFSPIVDDISERFSEAKQKVQDIWKDIKQWFEDHVTSKVSKPFKDATDKIGSDFNSLWKSIKNGAIGAMNSAIASIETAINRIVSGLNKIIKGFNKVVSWAAKVAEVNWGGVSTIPTVSLSRIPMLAEGGYVKANTPQLAIIGDNKHQGEIVSPEDKLDKMALKAAQLARGSADNDYLIQMILLMKQQNELLQGILEKETGITRDDIGQNAREWARDYFKRTGDDAFAF